MDILITGRVGFIGSHLAEALIQRGDRVTVLENLSTGKCCQRHGVLQKSYPSIPEHLGEQFPSSPLLALK